MMVPALIPQGYFVEFIHPQDEGFGHVFCGPHEIPGAWCPNCDKLLLRFLSLDTRDPRLGLQDKPFPFLHLLNCWTCNIAHDPLFYRVNPDGGVSLIKYGMAGVEEDFPYEYYPRHFPGTPIQLVPLTEDEQLTICQINEGILEPFDTPFNTSLSCPTHQVGGEPWLVQSDWDCWKMDCPECGEEMPCLASIGDSNLLPRGFTENSYVQFVFSYCPECDVVGALQQCD